MLANKRWSSHEVAALAGFWKYKDVPDNVLAENCYLKALQQLLQFLLPLLQ